ncbi:hypothetical protein ACIPY0_13385 [Paenarthrobacter nicotinovorans]|uniref:hypothetical protein n=1 Tax=Paenarthrobacter nicotinovorans TaxID=29320 RepID=UPI0038067E7B
MTAAVIPALLDPIQERLDAATPGPWTDALGKTFKAVGSIADARFIVNAPTDTARLLAAVKAVTDLHKQDTYGPAFCICTERWPCSTVSAVEAALRGEA